MEIEVPATVAGGLARLEAAVRELGAGLEALHGRQLKDVITSADLAPREQAQALMALSMAGNSLLRAHAQLQGRDPDTLEQLKSEQARQDLYVERVRKAVNDYDLATTRRTLELDVGAVNRFISQAISDPQRKQQLRATQSKRKRGGAS